METHIAYAIRSLSGHENWTDLIEHIRSAHDGALASLSAIDPNDTVEIARRQGAIHALRSTMFLAEEAKHHIDQAAEKLRDGKAE